MSKIVNLNKNHQHKKHKNEKSPHVLDLRIKTDKIKNNNSSKTRKDSKIVMGEKKDDLEKKVVAENILLVKKNYNIINATFNSLNKFNLFKKKKFQPSIDKLLVAQERIKKTKPNLKIEKEPIKPFFGFEFKHALVNMFLFLILSAVLVLPIRGFAYYKEVKEQASSVIAFATSGAQYLKTAKDAGLQADFDKLSTSFSEAQKSFALAQNKVDEINNTTQTLARLIPGISGTFQAGESVLSLGEILSKIGQSFSSSMEMFKNGVDISQSPMLSLATIKRDMTLILAQLKEAEKIADEINLANIPEEYVQDMSNVKNYLPVIVPQIEKMIDFLGTMQVILGAEEGKRYLVVFQNNNEIRATGGFIGSYVLVDINEGRVTNLEIPAGGSYDLEGGEQKNVTAPEPLWLINSQWHFWDANWFFDFPTSAEKLVEFYNNSGGPTVDGVIAINATLMQDLVGKIGPITVPGYEEALTGENFIQILQTENYENKLEKNPKQLLSDAGPIIIDKIINNQASWVGLLPVLESGLKQKDLQIFFKSYDLQKKIMNLGWSGRVLDADKDYLAVVHTNLGGGKTDQVIENEIWHHAEVLDSGEIEDTLIITRSHQGVKGDIFTGTANNDYLRVYVPLGSELVVAKGFSEMPAEAFEAPEATAQKDSYITNMEINTKYDESSQTAIFNESNKTVFANWLHLEPGETKSVYLKYKLPFTITQLIQNQKDYSFMDQVGVVFKPDLSTSAEINSRFYSMIIQKQSGLNKTKLISSVKIPDLYQMIWAYPEDGEMNNNIYKTTRDLNKDLVNTVMF
jgi:hypothetical protein